jgi:hypothetical protein
MYVYDGERKKVEEENIKLLVNLPMLSSKTKSYIITYMPWHG